MSSPADPHLPVPPWSEGESHEDRQQRYRHLDHVCQHHLSDRLQHLLVAGWDINECFFTSPWAEECQHVLNMAVWHCWDKGVKDLLDAGANTHRASCVECSPVPAMPDAVINFCNLVTEARSLEHRNPEKLAEIECGLNIVRMLIKAGCDVNRAGEDGLPILQIAARCHDTRVLRLLLSAGAKVNMQNDRASAKGRSPLTKAVDVNNKAAVKLLLQYGANVNIRCQIVSIMPGGRVMFQGLVARSLDLKHYDITELLVHAGSNVNLQDRTKLESLIMAVTEPEKQDDGHNDGWETEEEEEILGQSNAGDQVIIHREGLEDYSNLQNADNSNLPVVSPRRRLSTKDRHLAELFRLTQLMSKPLSLKGLCRQYLRLQLGFHNPERVKLLAVPRVLKEYLLCRDL